MAEKFVATEPLFIGRDRAANPGDEISRRHPLFDEWQKAGKVKSASVKASEPKKS